jgi:hypothetical protein
MLAGPSRSTSHIIENLRSGPRLEAIQPLLLLCSPLASVALCIPILRSDCTDERHSVHVLFSIRHHRTEIYRGSGKFPISITSLFSRLDCQNQRSKLLAGSLQPPTGGLWWCGYSWVYVYPSSARQSVTYLLKTRHYNIRIGNRDICRINQPWVSKIRPSP